VWDVRQADGAAANAGDATASKLAAALKRNTTLSAADLRYSGITDAGAIALADALPTIRAVRSRTPVPPLLHDLT
jgi:hypothetical protein